MQLSRKLIVIILITLGILSIIVLGLRLWKEEPLSYGLVYLHPVGNWRHISRIHWLGSPSQFREVYPLVESDFANISKAGYKSILFQTAIACLEPYGPYSIDFDYKVLKQNVKWITDKAKDYGLEVYVLYYPDWRSEDYGQPNIGYYYDEDSENWNLMRDFTYFLVQECPGVRWVAPFSLTRNITKVEYFFNHIGILSPKILMHADQSFVYDLITNYPSQEDENVSTPLNYLKLLEVYDVDQIPVIKDINEHIITGQKRINGSLTQGQQVNLIKTKINMLGKQRNIMIWCYADYPDSSYPEDFGLVQTSDETLPLAEVWKQICVQNFHHSLFFMRIIKTRKT